MVARAKNCQYLFIVVVAADNEGDLQTSLYSGLLLPLHFVYAIGSPFK